MIFVGIDWAEAHHDVCVLDEVSVVLAKGRVDDGVVGAGPAPRQLSTPAQPPEPVVAANRDRGQAQFLGVRPVPRPHIHGDGLGLKQLLVGGPVRADEDLDRARMV